MKPGSDVFWEHKWWLVYEIGIQLLLFDHATWIYMPLMKLAKNHRIPLDTQLLMSRGERRKSRRVSPNWHRALQDIWSKDLAVLSLCCITWLCAQMLGFTRPLNEANCQHVAVERLDAVGPFGFYPSPKCQDCHGLQCRSTDGDARTESREQCLRLPVPWKVTTSVTSGYM